jgi:ABC-type branched-subunit amino acid transport system ATPase component
VAAPTARTAVEQPSTGGLEVRDLGVHYGGIAAVEHASLAVPAATITGLIGPNGAGKTTTFNACSGLVRPDHGDVLLDGHAVTRRSPSARARSGLGRTFQRMELFDSLSVRENVAMGWEGSRAGPNPLGHLRARRAEQREAVRRSWEAMELCDIAVLADTPAGSLSTGHRRLVELARCLAGDYHVLLLDEPSSGLDAGETARFGQILTRVVRGRGIGILLVEHDMELVMDVCQRIYVLDFGRMIFEGTPAEVRGSPLVRAAYLGDDEVEDAVRAVDRLALQEARS